jgi:diguanylate cyclase (GGDEF)-like protein
VLGSTDRDADSGAASRPSEVPRWWIGPVVFVAVAVGYAGLAQATVWLHDPSPLGPVFWPGAGLSLAALLLLPARRWGWVVAAVVTGELTGNLVVWDLPLEASLWWTVANAVEPLVGAGLLRRYGNPRGLLVPLANLRSFLIFGVLAGPAIGASIGMFGTVASAGATATSFGQVWPSYLLSDALGVLVVAPLLLAWRDRRLRRHPAEAVAMAVIAVGLAALAFGDTGAAIATSLPYAVLPLLTWAALRFGIQGAAVAVFVMTQVAVRKAAEGGGLFPPGAGDADVVLPIFLLGAALTVFVLAAVVEGLADSTEVERQLTAQALRDDLTGLPNRRYLTEHLSRPVSRSDGRVVVLAADLDHFKFINDGHGHLAGDEVLIEVARRLEAGVGPGGVVARSSGDEFIAVVDIDDAAIDPLARRLMASVAEPMTLSTGSVLSQTISIGIADGSPPDDPELALREADAALHHAKRTGRARAHRFDEHLRAEDADRRMVQTDLHAGLTRGHITCHYQPEIDLATGHVFCFEALARWNHPTQGLLTPARFIPAIEDMGAIGQLFESVLDQALTVQTDWTRRLGWRPGLAVNLSANQLGDHTLPATVAAALDRAGAPAESLWLEVTETALARHPIDDLLLELHEVGVKLAIDDFGTGWSSVSRLAAFPWDLLKIDRSFVTGLGPGDDHAHRIIRSTITMAHDLGMLTTAEGVETPHQLQQLAELGCDYAQGYLFTRPLPEADTLTHVTHDHRWTGPGSRTQPGSLPTSSANTTRLSS